MNDFKEEITADFVRSLFNYNETTGKLIRKIKTSNNVKVGDVVGCLRSDGYLCVSLKDKLYQVHRVIWLYMTGNWPENQIDHINGNRSDNRFLNLRDVNNSTNGKNQKLSSANKSGVNGVYWISSRNKWRAIIFVDGKERHIGYFETLEEAAIARKAADIEYGFHNNHGKQETILEEVV